MNLLFGILLQITTTPTVTPEEAAPEGLSIFSLLMKGGFIMIPILLLWFIATYIFIERFLYLRTAAKVRKPFLQKFTKPVRVMRLSEVKSI